MKTLRFFFSAPGALALAFTLCPGGNGAATAGDTNPVLIGSWPGFTRGGPEWAIIAVGSHAYAVTGAGLEILDLSQPSNPQHLASCAIDGCPMSLAVSGHFAYLGGYEGLDVIDVADPRHPQPLGHYPGPYPYGLGCVAISGNHAFVTGQRYEGTNWIPFLEVVDTTDPANPQRLGWRQTRKPACDLVVSANYAYVAENEQDAGGLEVMDVSNPADPKPVGWYDAGVAVWKVALSGNRACLGNTCGLQVIDLSNPVGPRRVGQIDTNWSFGRVCLALSGDYAYVGAGSTLKAIDLSDPARPQLVGESDRLFGEAPLSVAVSDLYAYVGFWDSGLEVIDISNPTKPQSLGLNEIMGRTVDVALAGNYAYLAEGYAGLRVIDVANLASPRKVGEYQCLSNAAVGAVTISDTNAYLNVDGRVEVVDISHPAAPKHVGWYDPHDSFFRNVVVSGKYAYLGGADGLQVIDVSQPADPRKAGGLTAGPTGYALDTGGSGHGYQRVAVSGTHAYVANGAAGLLVLDMSNPTNITMVGELKTKTTEDAWWIEVSGHFALLADAFDLNVIDISDPANPLLVGQYEPPLRCFHTVSVVAAGNYVYLVLNECGPGAGMLLRVLDISDPTHPHLAGERYFLEGGPAVVAGNLICMAGGREGLWIFEMQPFIKSIVRQGQDLKLSWDGFGVARLQRATNLFNADWSDVPGAEATNVMMLPIEGPKAFFRLVKP